MKLVHISDVHNEDTLPQIVDYIAENHPTAVTISTGDHADNATRKEFESVYEQYEKIHRIVMPGNHDRRYAGNIEYPEPENVRQDWGETLGEFEAEVPERDGLRYEHIAPGVVFIAIDSNDSKSLFARGYVSPELCRDLKVLLDDLEGRTRIVALHHHPFDNDYLTALENSNLLMKALSGRCEVLLFGHEHKLYVERNTHGIPLVLGSHKTTEPLNGKKAIGINVIDIKSKTDIKHWIDII